MMKHVTRIKGFAFIYYLDLISASRAVQAMQNGQMEGVKYQCTYGHRTQLALREKYLKEKADTKIHKITIRAKEEVVEEEETVAAAEPIQQTQQQQPDNNNHVETPPPPAQDQSTSKINTAPTGKAPATTVVPVPKAKKASKEKQPKKITFDNIQAT